MLKPLVRGLTLLCYLVLIVVGVAWPRSYFYADKWWVTNTNPYPATQANSTGSWTNGWDGSSWTHGCAWMSLRGCLLLVHADYVFAPGEWRSEPIPQSSRTTSWLPKRDWMGFVVPYWCIGLAAAVLPVATSRLRGAAIEAPRYRVAHFLIATAAIALVAAGFARLGAGGAVAAAEVVIVTLIVATALKRFLNNDSSRARTHQAESE